MSKNSAGERPEMLSFESEESAELERLHHTPHGSRRFLRKFNIFSRYFRGALTKALYSKKFAKVHLLYLVLFLVLGAMVLTHPATKDAVVKTKSQYHSSFKTHSTVSRKKDLLSVGLSKALRFKTLKTSPITERVLNQDYRSDTVIGYISNLDTGSIKPQKPLRKRKDNEDGYSDVLTHHQSYDTQVTCHDLEYQGKIEYSKWSKVLDDDLIQLKNDIIENWPRLAPEVQDESEKDWSDEKILKENWFRFGGSSVWLEKEQCYLMVSRVIYSRKHWKSYAHISLLRVQAFDKEWNEIKGKRIAYSDILQPENLDKELEKLDEHLGLLDCEVLDPEGSEYSSCVTKNNERYLEAQKRKKKIVSQYAITFPTILDVDFEIQEQWSGPEDPRIILKRGEDGTEDPVILFNMNDASEGKRFMYGYFPHKKIDRLVKFRIRGRETKSKEKNWTPFFHRNTETHIITRGFIHFVYNHSPLEILKCSLNDGFCDVVFEAKTLEISDGSKVAGIRGGTQYVPLPDILPTVEGKQIWVGFPKVHINGCGCGKQFYRPMLSLLVEHKGVYHQELMVPVLDFGMDILSWDLKGDYCWEINILSPNSISYWEVVGQDPKTMKFEDYLAFTVSEADSNTRVIILRGLLNYVLGIYHQKAMKESFEISEDSDAIVGKTLKCVMTGVEDNCKAYGKSHPTPDEVISKEKEKKKKEEEEKKKKEEEKKKKEEDEKRKKEEDEKRKNG